MTGGVRFTPVSPRDRAGGLLGWVSFSVAGLRIEGVAVRRTLDGQLTLSWPCRHDRHGRRHSVVRPVDDDARRRLEAAIFAELDLGEGVAQ